MNKEEIVRIEDAYSIAGFKKREISLDRAKDATLFDTDGKEYIDCVGGQGVCNIGHANPKVIEAIRTQAEKLIICPDKERTRTASRVYYLQIQDFIMRVLVKETVNCLLYDVIGNPFWSVVNTAFLPLLFLGGYFNLDFRFREK